MTDLSAPRPLPEADAVPRVISSRQVYAGKVVSLRVDEITLPRGGLALREVVYHPGAVVIVALDADGCVFLVRQYRHPVGCYLLELPAGGLETGEEPLAAAMRELREEVGIEAERWTLLGSFFSSPGFASERLCAFLAEGLTQTRSEPDYDEDISVVRLPVAGILERLGGALDAKTLACLLLLERALGIGLQQAT